MPRGEDDEYEILGSTQNPSETQHLVAHVLGLPSNRIVCRVKRLGGGFGGKETRSAFVACGLAVAARKFQRPVRCILSREEDMAMSGQRHPFLGKYKVGFTDIGKLISLELELFSNAGYSMDLSLAVMERALSHSDNCYFIPNLKATGKLCKTNTPTNTAFRGFGGPQGMMVAEHWIRHVAEKVGKPVEEIQRLNLYTPNQRTHYRQPLEEVHIDRCWEECVKTSDFVARKQLVEIFNKKNKWRKRGIAVVPTKYVVIAKHCRKY